MGKKRNLPKPTHCNLTLHFIEFLEAAGYIETIHDAKICKVKPNQWNDMIKCFFAGATTAGLLYEAGQVKHVYEQLDLFSELVDDMEGMLERVMKEMNKEQKNE